MAGVGDELVDVVDESGAVVGQVTRREMRARRLLHRSVLVVVTASDGRLLVQRRSEGKDLWPGRWDIGAGGVLGSGEAPLDGARRELAEELGIDAGELVSLGEYRYTDDDVDELATVYGTVHDGPFHFADGEVSQVRFLTFDELHGLIATGGVVPDSLEVLEMTRQLRP